MKIPEVYAGKLDGVNIVADKMKMTPEVRERLEMIFGFFEKADKQHQEQWQKSLRGRLDAFLCKAGQWAKGE